MDGMPSLPAGLSAFTQGALALRLRWNRVSREKQRTPAGDWKTWLVMAGRGWGKTRCGANDIADFAAWNPAVRCAVVAPTARDLRLVCYEGESGLMNTIPAECLLGGSADKGYNRTLGQIKLANGSIIEGFVGEEPGRLRGPQFHRAWVDELCAYEYPEETWDMLSFGLRLGEDPRVIITSTPKPIPLLRRIMADRTTLLTSGSTYENAANLANSFLSNLERYEGTTLGRQEIHAELIDLSEGAILKRPWWRKWTSKDAPRVEGYVLSIDTAFKDGMDNDCSALSAWGLWRPKADDEKGRQYNGILCRAWREKLPYPELRERLQEEYREYRKRGLPVIALIEDKASGQSLIQELLRAGIACYAYNPGRTDKVMRAHLASDVLKGGRLFVPMKLLDDGETRSDVEMTEYAEMLVKEVEEFPNGEYKDLTDTVTQFINYVRDFGGFDLPSDWTEEDEAEMGEEKGNKRRRGGNYSIG